MLEALREDGGRRDPATYIGWPLAHGRDHVLSLVSRDDRLSLLAKSDQTPVGYLAGERPATSAHASNDAAARFYEHIGLAPMSVTLAMPL